MAEMAKPQGLERETELEIVSGLPEGMAVTETADNAHLLLSETLTRGTGCLSWARPGLRGFRVGDCPVLLGQLPRMARHGKQLHEKAAGVFDYALLRPFP